MRHQHLGIFLAGGAMLAMAATAHAQTAPAAAAQEADPSEIIVTATKEKQTLQQVPISVGVVNGKAMADQGVRLFTDLQSSVPNLQIDNT
ncbi:MAG: TonB-dependent receptor, partial [Proteobacteria bacterium]|nr:TonB-dependent receptor [Pseudomonadota bacterium]